jgi:hypothetical protein
MLNFPLRTGVPGFRVGLNEDLPGFRVGLERDDFERNRKGIPKAGVI